MDYDLVVVGAGPAGLAFCASSAVQGKRILLVESGKPLAQRDSQNPSDVGTGVTGAGAYIDGKLSFFPAGTALWSGAYGQLSAAYAEMETLMRHHLVEMPAMPSEAEVLDYFFQPDEHWKLKRYPSLYMDEEARLLYLQQLVAQAERHAELRCHTTVLALEPQDEGFKLELRAPTGQQHVTASAVVLAGGRFMPLQQLTRALPSSECFRRHEFGIRLELPRDNAAMQSLAQRGVLDPKLVMQPRAGVQFRTFCFCKRGVVCSSRIGELVTYSGRADVAPTERTNFGLMARTSNADAFSSADIERFLRDPFQLELTSKTVPELRREARKGLLANCGSAVGGFLWDALEQLFAELPALCCRGLVLYGPCLEGVGAYPNCNAHLEVANVPNLYAIGDTSGMFRGLVPSLLSGYYLAESLQQRERGPTLLTSNAEKAFELRAALGPLRLLHFSDASLLSADVRQHAVAKAQFAAAQLKSQHNQYAVEATALEIDVLGGYPGVHVGEFFRALGVDRIYALCKGSSATFISVIALIKESGDIQLFEGRCCGTIVPPSGSNGFDWDCLFRPEGYAQTYGEMSRTVKTRISARFHAAQQLRQVKK